MTVMIATIWLFFTGEANK